MKSAEKNHMRVKIRRSFLHLHRHSGKIRELEEFSKDYDELYFQIALNYGSRDEIVRGSSGKLAQDVADGKCTPSEIDESLLENYLDSMEFQTRIC